MRKTLAVVCVALLALGTLGACGENDEETAKANIQEGVLTDDSASGGAPLSEDQAECFADGMVDKLGVEKLQDYGLLDDDLGFVGDANPTDMSADDAEAAAGVLTDCVDFGDLLDYLLGYDLSAFEVRKVPATDALKDQKAESLRGFWRRPLASIGATGAVILALMLSCDWPWDAIGLHRRRFGPDERS